MPPIVWQLLLQIVLISLNAVFACAEIALLDISETKLNALASKGNKRARRLLKLTKDPAKFLATIQVAITLSGFLASAFAANSFSDDITDLVWRYTQFIPRDTLQTLAMILVTLILSYFTLVFGELVPKRIAMKKSEDLALKMSGGITFISKLFAPIVFLLTASTNGILRLFGIDPHADTEEVTEEEILLMVDAGSEKGSIEEEEKDIIQNVFEFNDISAGEIATHRTDIAVLCVEDESEEWAQIIHDNRHTFYPVCGESIDDIVGVVNAKDYFRLADQSRDNVMATILRPPYLVPESVRADVLLRNMRSRREYFAIVIDEYGGTKGIVTLTDLIQCIIGDIEEADGEGDDVSLPDIEKIDDVTYRILGLASIDEVAEELNMEEDFSECDCDTFGGYIMSLLDAIPEDGATPTVDTEKLSIHIAQIKDHRIEMAVVVLKSLPIELDGETEEE